MVSPCLESPMTGCESPFRCFRIWCHLAGARAQARVRGTATAGAGSGVKGRGVPAGRRRGHDQRGSLVALAARAGAVQQRAGLARHAAIVLDLPLLHVLLEPPRVAARERVVRLARVGVLHRRLQHASRRAVEGEEQATTGAAVEPMHLLRVGTGPWAATWGEGAGAGAGPEAARTGLTRTPSWSRSRCMSGTSPFLMKRFRCTTVLAGLATKM